MSLELEGLLKVISDEAPCGIDCSFSNEFYAIKKARIQDDPLLEQGDWVAEPKQADWAFVSSQSIELLTEKTKDIRLYGWLLEAWSNLYGFEGIAEGLELTQQSLTEFWMQLHPEIAEDDLDQRLGLLQGLINQLPVLIKKTAITNTAISYSLMDYEALLHQQNLRRKHTEDYDDVPTNTSLEQFEQELFNTSKSFQYKNYQAFLEILKQWNILREVLDGLMGVDAPSFAAIESQLESLHSNLKKIYKTEAFGLQPAMATADSVDEKSAADQQTSTQLTEHIAVAASAINQPFQPHIQSHVANREQAMQVLQEISDYFQLNEPHSPVSYMLQKTIKWSQMPLHEWLAQVIKHEDPLEAVHEILGVQRNTNDTYNDG